VASTGTEGLDLFRKAAQRQQPFDAIITDLGMPDIDGREIARTVKLECPGMPVVMMTGWGTMMKQAEEVVPNVDALMGKPPRIKELNELLLLLTATS
jgi:CheY-like chemotaxis protein